jgi:predicted  nucleic acid-binding Zn-ribbon protein
MTQWERNNIMAKDELKGLLENQTSKIEKRFDKTDSKIEQIETHCANIDKTNIAQQKDIENYIRRTNLLEESIKETEKIASGADMKIEKHKSKHAGAYALLFIAGAILGFVLNLARFF